MTINKNLAHLDSAMPIEFGQTISQPSLVLLMTELLETDPQMRVLEIGTGSGYQTCLLAEFSKDVYTVERIPELSTQAMKRLELMGYSNIHYFINDGSMGLLERAPYDRIMVTAAARCIPDELMDQLAPMGIMIIPVGNAYNQHLTRVKKDINGKPASTMIEAVRFVPLIGKYSI